MNATEDLRLRTKKFALRVIKLYQSLPTYGAPQVIGKQLLRCGTAVGANYRAAGRARSRAEFAAKLGIGLKFVITSGRAASLVYEKVKSAR